MDEVMVNGVRYIPATTQPTGRIGVGVTSHDRPEILARARTAWDKHLPPGAELVIVDDASAKPVDGADYRFETQAGIARAKNKCLELLADRGCTEFFLFDSDAWAAVDDWWRPYVESPAQHAMYLWGAEPVIYTDEHVTAEARPRGVMLYATRHVLDVVGGLDPRFGLWGGEHESWSDRIHTVGLTTARYQDVIHEPGIIYACDAHEKVPSSVPEKVRHQANWQLAEATRNSSMWLPYREHDPAPATPRVALSVLIPSVHTRRATTAPKLTDSLFTQWEALPPEDQQRVEVVVLTDTKTRTLGHKRNQMVQDAAGQYVAFVDDDDRVEPDYLTSLLEAIDTHHPDVVTFGVTITVDGGRPKRVRYSLDYQTDHTADGEYHRLPNHLMAVRRDLAARNPFPDQGVGEDSEYAARLRPLLLTEHAIDRVLYHYDYDTAGTETQLTQKYRAQIIRASRPPVADIVILANSHTTELAKMTQHTIDTARTGAGEVPVNVVVVEQTPGIRHRDAITIHTTQPFAYNAFANQAATTGRAPWIVVANNDLDFQPGWLDHLLAAKHPLVSPANPGDRRQSGITRNETGITNGRHFSGWCFMLKRTLWEKIGGLDEDFRFWCADDSVIEQATRAGVKPMLVPRAKVTHLTSRTIGQAPPDELTWEQVARFEEKYGVKKFEGDKRYQQWKRKHQHATRTTPTKRTVQAVA